MTSDSEVFKLLGDNYGFSQNDLNLLEGTFESETFKKNEIILETGEVCRKVYFVKKGLLRTFHINQNGTEFTRLFAKEFEFCTILISFSNQIESAASIQAMEDTDVYSMTLSSFRDLTSKSIKSHALYTSILEDFQNFQISRIEFLTTCSPQEKVEKFLNENRDLEQRISDKIIATYLQITPETYSRCRRKLFS